MTLKLRSPIQHSKILLLESPITIQVVGNKTDLNTFIQFPYKLYNKCGSWVPPLLLSQKQLLDKHHLFWVRNPHCFFLALKEGRCVGRIAAFINKEHNEYHNSSQGFFGFLEAIEDPAVFNTLFKAAEEYISGYGCRTIIGPFNPSLHYELGVLTKGFDRPPYFMLTHNFDYYGKCILSSGYNGLKDFYSYKLDAKQFKPTPKMERVKSHLHKRYPLIIRNANLKEFDNELDIIYEIYNDAFVGHWGFTPIEKEEFRILAKDMKSIVDPKLVLIAELNMEPVAFLLCLPNFNEVFIKIKNGRLFPFGILKLLTGKNKIKTVRVITAAVKKKYQHLGIGAALYPEIMKRAIDGNYNTGELSWVVEDNYEMNRIANDLGAEAYKTYRIYSKEIGESTVI
jgi:hypothetical protein